MKIYYYSRFKSCLIIALIVIAFWLAGCSQNKSMLPKEPVSAYSYVPEEQQIIPMPPDERIKPGILPHRGLCSIIPGGEINDLLMSGNGKMNIRVAGNPLSDKIIFRHERLLVPWKMPFEAPKIAYVLPEVRKLILEGQYDKALNLSLDAAAKAGVPQRLQNHELIPAFTMNIDQPKNGPVHNYLRTVDFESGEISVLWEDLKGKWKRQAFVSRPDNVVVQLLSAPPGQLLDTKIALNTSFPDQKYPVPVWYYKYIHSSLDTSNITFGRDYNEHRLIVEGHFDPATGNIGYAGVVRVVLNGGKARIENDALVVEGATSLMLLTRIEWYKDFQKSKVEELASNLEKINPDYQELLAHNREVQSEIINRASLNFNSSTEEKAMSGEELLADQKTRIGHNPELLSKLFDMGRYWLALESGDFPPIYGHINGNVNLQIAGGEMANLPATMNAFYNWIEGVLPDSRKNAQNIFSARGALFSVHPDQQQGVLYHIYFGWPNQYWISGGGWVYNTFWDHYLVSGDQEFLRNRIMPGLRELALFYEDYLKSTDNNGNYIFVPSFSPENFPSNTYQGSQIGGENGNLMSSPLVINATMDIMVCREVLTHLIEGAGILGTDAENIPKWKTMLSKMPNYLLDSEGALKEWSWPSLEENPDHRHASHLYGVWPGNEIDPDRTPQLAKAVWLANRKHAHGNGSGHGISHRALAAARLKDSYLVDYGLEQLLEQGYFGPVLTSSHNPYTEFMPDQQGSVLDIMMEMLIYSRPGVIEFLPALPNTLEKGEIKGILARSFAKVDDMTWDLKSKKIDATITSLKDQDVSLIVRYGIESITVPNDVQVSQNEKDFDRCNIRLHKDKPVTIHLKLGNHKPSDWILQVDSPTKETVKTSSLLPKDPVSAFYYVPEDQQIIPMPLAERVKRGVVPHRGICSIMPGGRQNDMLKSGNGKLRIDLTGNPLSEKIYFSREHLIVKWGKPFKAPKIAYILPDVKKLILEGQYSKAVNMAFDAAKKAGNIPNEQNQAGIPAFVMNLDQPKAGIIHNYLRTIDFESGEIKVLWEDQKGQWERSSFVSRPDNIAVLLLTAPQGQKLNTRIALTTHVPKSSNLVYERDFNEQRLIVEGHFDPKTGNTGYAGVVRVVVNGGKGRIENGALVVEDAKSMLLLSSIEVYKDLQKKNVEEQVSNLEKVIPDYKKLLARNREIQSELINRLSINFDPCSTPDKNAMSGEELIADQKRDIGYNKTLLSKIFDMSRYWQIYESGDLPPLHGLLNINVNLCVCAGEMADMPEAMNAFYNWVEGTLPDSRANAKNIFGARGALVSVLPDNQQSHLWDVGWPHFYWISAGGWAYNPFWDHYLVSGDKEFLRNRIMPGLKELVLFYEDYLTERDKNGNYIFMPSYSPESWPSNTSDGKTFVTENDVQQGAAAVINSTMDLMVCQDVLTHLIRGAEILGTEVENVPKWRAMLAKMPNCLLARDGALKEWSWPTINDRQDHRHASHLYGAWPGDGIDPDRTPQMAKATWLANRKRAQGNASGHGISHRMLAAARLKDNYLVNFELKQLLEQGYFGPLLTAAHNPYSWPIGDQQGSVLDLMMEMLIYSREGVIELLPAVPESLDVGNIKGVLARTFAKVDDLTWNLASKTIDVTITSLRDQDISLIVRYGIESITSTDGVITRQPSKDSDRCVLQLQKGKPATFHLEIGDHKPSDWITKVASR